MSLGDGLTWADWVRLIASDYGVSLTDDAIDFVLWERTAWPVADVAHVREQLHAFFAGCPNENRPPKGPVPMDSHSPDGGAPVAP